MPFSLANLGKKNHAEFGNSHGKGTSHAKDVEETSFHCLSCARVYDNRTPWATVGLKCTNLYGGEVFNISYGPHEQFSTVRFCEIPTKK